MKLSTREMVFAALFAALTGVLAQLTIPFGPIPLTMQTFAVAFTSTLLGKKIGTLTVLLYLFMGAIGLPVFAGGNAGFSVIFGPTGGFLIGFVFTALSIGWILENTRKTYFWAITANLTGALITLLFGVLWLKVSAGMPWQGALAAGMIPFLVPSAIKAVLAGYLGLLIMRRLPRSLRLSN
ncbi:biotin synthesis protein BioY [Enterococcus florum]|uniref:Biotin transporter n=1 Tax=Enterococcus florum TaxID=2480627 RepID=A0A4P5P8A8_9ENTE|nr:biotin transporter BioY [Enterococcus florum]GCF94070.1 biotin synthesis protein BioY [Enterococcus florum]